jgi:hypothetical protein
MVLRYGDFCIISDSEKNILVRNSEGETSSIPDALDACGVGSQRLSIKQLLWLRMMLCQLMAEDGLIEPDPKTWV